MEPLPVLTKACAGLAAALLVVTIAFLIVPPYVSVGVASFNCGAPALWYPEGREDSASIEALGQVTGTAPGARIPSCHDEIDTRLLNAGLSAAGAATMLVVAVLAALIQQRRLRVSWERSIQRSESPNFRRSRFSRRLARHR